MRGRKLTGEKVRAIRCDLDMGVDIGALSRRYFVLPGAIIDIKNRRTWGDSKYIPAAFCHECGGKVVENDERTIALCVECGTDYIGKLFGAT
jgi:hypothetical protein